MLKATQVFNLQRRQASVFVEIVAVWDIAGAADANLHAAMRINHPFLNRAPDVGAVGLFMAAETGIGGIGMCIKLERSDRAILGQGAQDGKGEQMVAPRRQRFCSCGMKGFILRCDHRRACANVDGVHRPLLDWTAWASERN